MPVMDGYAMLSKLRQLPQFQKTPIIVSSASVFETDKYKSLHAGANEFLPKPIQTDRLLEALRVHLKLEWVYEVEEQGGKQSIPHTKTYGNEIVPPSPEDLAILHDLSRKGLIKNLLMEIERIEKIDQKFIPFAQQLRQFANSFQLRQMRTFVEQYL
jgi:response regulator RpfG family c-di-GMP phosphodiesterase